MPQLQPFFYTQELGSALVAIALLSLFIACYCIPSLTVVQSVRRYMTSL